VAILLHRRRGLLLTAAAAAVILACVLVKGSSADARWNKYMSCLRQHGATRVSTAAELRAALGGARLGPGAASWSGAEWEAGWAFESPRGSVPYLILAERDSPREQPRLEQMVDPRHAYFRQAVRHPERFDAVLVLVGSPVKRLIATTNTCALKADPAV
jgi:hypothetical protein